LRSKVLLFMLFGVLVSNTARAQSQLVPLVTDQTPMALSNYFGRAYVGLVNQAGDYAFWGIDSSALFLRRASASAPIYVFQAGDGIPGLPGSTADEVYQLRLNSSGLLAFQVDFTSADGVFLGAILTLDGATLRTVVTGLQTAPGIDGATFQRSISLIGLNDSGVIAFSSGLVASNIPGTQVPVPARTTLFIVPAGGSGDSALRMVGLGDEAPDGGTFAAITGLGFNNKGEILFQATIADGTRPSGLFIGAVVVVDGVPVPTVRKVVAVGDPTPDATGTFASVTSGLLNNAGQVAFTANMSPPPAPASYALWVSSPLAGLARVASTGEETPAGGNFNIINNPVAFNDAGTIAFTSSVTAPVSGSALFRALPGQPAYSLQKIAYRTQPAPGTGGQTFSGYWSAISMNASGTVSFRPALSAPVASGGLYRQAGGDPPTPLALDGQASGTPIGGTYLLRSLMRTFTLDTGAVLFDAEIIGGSAEYGQFLTTGDTTAVLVSGVDELPEGHRLSLKTFRTSGAGNHVGFMARYTGGRLSLLVHDITARVTSVVVTDGDPAPGGGLMRIAGSATSVNAEGHVAFVAPIVGIAVVPGSTPTALFLWRSGEPIKLTKIAATGDVVPSSSPSRTFASVSLGYRPSPLNDADQVVFSGSVASEPGLPALSGLFLGSPAGVRKIALRGEIAPNSSGLAFYSFSAVDSTINQLGQVAFRAVIGTSTGLRSGIYVYTPGVTPQDDQLVKVAVFGDPGPGSSTFADFGSPAFNNAGQIAFMAKLAGGPAGAVFLGMSSGSGWTLTALAIDGEPAPAGGDYSFTRWWHDLAINDRGDVVFRADLESGASAGYFLRRYDADPPLVEKLVLQGDPAPGGLTFDILTPGFNAVLGEFVQLDQDGNIAFGCHRLVDGRPSFGIWHVTPTRKLDGTPDIKPILVRGLIDPAFGGGRATVSTPSISWNSGARYPVWIRVSGGTFTDAIVLYVPAVPEPTPAGSNVTVAPTDATTGLQAAAITFDAVAEAGVTTLTTSAGGPTVPSAFSLGETPVFYNVTTTAVVTGPIEVRFAFNPARFPNPSTLRLLHYEGGVWRDVTTGCEPVVDNTICGSVTSLSPFAVVQDVAPPTIAVSVTPTVIWPPNNKLVRVTANVTASDPGDPAPVVTLVSITSNEPAAPDDIQAAIGTDCRTFLLRASRLGGGTGRTYTITYRATDASGLVTEKAVTVIVPHDQGGR
jgi:hypothetical protein